MKARRGPWPGEESQDLTGFCASREISSSCLDFSSCRRGGYSPQVKTECIRVCEVPRR